jgi:hypothetical protein
VNSKTTIQTVLLLLQLLRGYYFRRSASQALDDPAVVAAIKPELIWQLTSARDMTQQQVRRLACRTTANRLTPLPCIDACCMTSDSGAAQALQHMLCYMCVLTSTVSQAGSSALLEMLLRDQRPHDACKCMHSHATTPALSHTVG